MTIRAKGHHILIRIEKPEEKTKGGIVLVDQTREADKRSAEIGEVIEVGPTAYMNDGLGNEPWVKAGERIFFAKYSGKWAYDPKNPEVDDLLFIRDDDVIGAIE